MAHPKDAAEGGPPAPQRFASCTVDIGAALRCACALGEKDGDHLYFL